MPILIVVLLTLISWHGILSQTFIKEGFMYFSDNQFFCSVGIKGFLTGLLRYDVFPRFFFWLSPKIFSDNLQLYILLMLLIITISNIVFYLLVYELTGRRMIALLASVFFVVNYVSLYELLATGQYQWLVQRIPSFIFVFLSFILFVRFLKRKASLAGYGWAVVLYFLAVLMSHYSLYFLPMFIVYAVFSRKLPKSIFLAIPFFTSFSIVWLGKNFGCGSLLSQSSFFSFLLYHDDLIADVAYQLTIITLPSQILRLFVESNVRLIVIGLSAPLFAFYLIAIIWLYFKEKKLRVVMLSAFLFFLVSLLLNVYIRETEVRYVYETSRYFHVPSMGLSIFLAILLYSLFYRRGLLGKILLLLITLSWITANTNLIWKKMVQEQRLHIANKITMNYLKNILPKYPQDAFVVTPYILDGYASSFYRLFYGSSSMTVTPIYIDWEDRLEKDFDLERLFVLDYDYAKGKIVDKSGEFRSLMSARGKMSEGNFNKIIKEKKMFEAEKAKFIKN